MSHGAGTDKVWEVAFLAPRLLPTGLVLALGVLGAQGAFAQDTITFENGDRLTGRIKRLDRGELVLKVPVADGDVRVDWARVATVDSQRVFQFQTIEGVRFLGRIQPETDPVAGTMVVEFGGVTRTYQRDAILLMVETVGQLRGLLEVSASGGLTVSKGNDQKQINGEATISYETPAFGISASVNSIFSTQREGTNVNRQNASVLFNRNLRQRLGWSLLNDYLVNDEQQLDLRTLVGGGLSYALVRSNRIELSTLGGAVWNNERFSPESGQEVNNDVEAIGGLLFTFFEFKQWELDSTFTAYSSLSSSDRFRTSTRATLRLRLLQGRSFWWNITQTLDTDTNPPADTDGTDYLTSTSISWTFP